MQGKNIGTARLRLVQRALRGDEQAFATLYQLHNKLVYSVCVLMTKDAAEAEDLAQETFIQAFRNLNSFRGLVQTIQNCSGMAEQPAAARSLPPGTRAPRGAAWSWRRNPKLELTAKH